jgi:hypothetical protein
MGYLNNSSRTLDAILTKKGRELLSSGGNFEVTQFALGDDEIDYSLWDASHTQGTDYYGAVIENLPALEPFNDPSEIMKYKLVSRSQGTTAMAKIQPPDDVTQGTHSSPDATTGAGSTNTGLHGLAFIDEASTTNWHAVSQISADNGVVDTNWKLGSFAPLKIQHVDNQNTQDVPDYVAHDLFPGYGGETFTITLLDTSIAIMAPPPVDPTTEGGYPVVASQTIALQSLWYPFLESPQRLSQTISGVSRNAANELRGLVVYAKRISSKSSPAKTSIIITGEDSGAVFEYDVTVTYYSSNE